MPKSRWVPTALLSITGPVPKRAVMAKCRILRKDMGHRQELRIVVKKVGIKYRVLAGVVAARAAIKLGLTEVEVYVEEPLSKARLKRLERVEKTLNNL